MPIHRSLHALVVVQQGPDHSCCLSLDLGVLIVLAEELHQAGEEIVFEEVGLCGPVVDCRVSNEQQDAVD